LSLALSLVMMLSLAACGGSEPAPSGAPAGAAVTNCENVVYDSSYGGFTTNDGAFFTRIDSSCNFVLEQIGESELPIDVEPEALFDDLA